MSNIPSRFECLPNELLIFIFQHFDARDLFRAFYNLNIRFNHLLQSLHYLSLTLFKYNSNEIDYYNELTPYIYTLIMDYAVNIDFNHFLNIHRLVLLSPTSSQLKQLVCNTLPYLEHLTIGYEHFLFCDHIPDLCEKIFSNGFPCLKSCSLLEPRILEIIPHMTQTIQLSILKMDNIDLLTYKSLLSLCPNLYILQFNILDDLDESCAIKPHLNLKRMIIKFQSHMKTLPDSIMNQYLSCVPNLEQFIVYEINFDVNIKEYLTFNWFASLTKKHFVFLRRLTYHLYIYGTKNYDTNLINHMKTHFKHVHKNRYLSQLVLNLV
ncbi:hypothetical protein I4U23_001518 [Adineta vaga]|nr:hypothetical protein I4U23_001518 [Adineta vaga]